MQEIEEVRNLIARCEARHGRVSTDVDVLDSNFLKSLGATDVQLSALLLSIIVVVQNDEYALRPVLRRVFSAYAALDSVFGQEIFPVKFSWEVNPPPPEASMADRLSRDDVKTFIKVFKPARFVVSDECVDELLNAIRRREEQNGFYEPEMNVMENQWKTENGVERITLAFLRDRFHKIAGPEFRKILKTDTGCVILRHSICPRYLAGKPKVPWMKISEHRKYADVRKQSKAHIVALLTEFLSLH